MKTWQYCLVGGFLALGLTACGGSDGGKGGGSSTPQTQTPGGGAGGNPAGGGFGGGTQGGGFGGGGFGGGTQGGFGGGFGGGTQGGNPGGGTQGGNPGGGTQGGNPGGGTQGGNPGGGTQGGNPGGGTQGGGTQGGGTQGGNPASDPNAPAVYEAFTLVDAFNDSVFGMLHNYIADGMAYRCGIKQAYQIMGEPYGTATVQNGQMSFQHNQPNDRLRVTDHTGSREYVFTKVQSQQCDKDYNKQPHDIQVRVIGVNTGRTLDIHEQLDAQGAGQQAYQGYVALYEPRLDYQISAARGANPQQPGIIAQSGELRSAKFTINYNQGTVISRDKNSPNEAVVMHVFSSKVTVGQDVYQWHNAAWSFNMNSQYQWVDGKFTAQGQVLKNNQPWGEYQKTRYAAGSGNLASIYVQTPLGNIPVITMNPRQAGGACNTPMDCQSNSCSNSMCQ